MKKLLYAIFALMAMFALNVYAINPDTVEVKELSQVEDKGRKYTWFWESTPDKEQTPSSSSNSAPKAAAPAVRPQGAPHMALLLPLTGQYSVAAQAVREGFISAYYLNARNNPASQIDLRIYDTVADKEVVRAYTKAVDEGANIIIGPLTKPGLDALIGSKRVDNNMTVIALNTLEGRLRLPRHLYLFALSPEDEAYRIAEQAWYDGRTHAAALVEQDSFGRRAVASFKRRFEQLGGQVSDIVYFNQNRDLEDPLRYVLKVEEIKNSTGEPTIYSRKDIDFLFLVAKPEQARQIPPLMQFYFAKGIPIYATGSIYSGVANPGRDSDLNGIIFCDSPWIINPNNRNSNLNSMAKQLLTQPQVQERLFAFGVDAFKVAKDINQLSSSTQFKTNGVTGQLSMDSSGFVVREPTCARFSSGVPRVL